MNCEFIFVGGSLDGARVIGEDANRFYRTTRNGVVGEQIRTLSTASKMRIEAIGFVAAHRERAIEREIYEVVERRPSAHAVSVSCRLVAVEKQ